MEKEKVKGEEKVKVVPTQVLIRLGYSPADDLWWREDGSEVVLEFQNVRRRRVPFGFSSSIKEALRLPKEEFFKLLREAERETEAKEKEKSFKSFPSVLEGYRLIRIAGRLCYADEWGNPVVWIAPEDTIEEIRRKIRSSEVLL